MLQKQLEERESRETEEKKKRMDEDEENKYDYGSYSNSNRIGKGKGKGFKPKGPPGKSVKSASQNSNTSGVSDKTPTKRKVGTVAKR